MELSNFYFSVMNTTLSKKERRSSWVSLLNTQRNTFLLFFKKIIKNIFPFSEQWSSLESRPQQYKQETLSPDLGRLGVNTNAAVTRGMTQKTRQGLSCRSYPLHHLIQCCLNSELAKIQFIVFAILSDNNPTIQWALQKLKWHIGPIQGHINSHSHGVTWLCANSGLSFLLVCGEKNEACCPVRYINNLVSTCS